MDVYGAHRNDWKDGEERLREREVEAAVENSRAQRLVSRVQTLIAFVAVFATLVAAFAANQAKNAVNATEQGSERQASENRLSTAITAIGGSTATERVAGVTLLRWNVAAEVESAAHAKNASERQNADALYATSLDVLANYLRGVGPAATNGTSVSDSTLGISAQASAPLRASFGQGYGVPQGQIPLDVIYAAGALRQLLSMRTDVSALGNPQGLGVDLSNVELWGQPWSGVRFDWLGGHYLVGIDLRSADLRKSRWGTTDLTGAYLQCADLSGADLRHTILTGADLRGANMTGADLRGASVSGADFEGAKLTDVNLSGAVGTATGLSATTSAWQPEASWNQPTCARNRGYWDMPASPLS